MKLDPDAREYLHYPMSGVPADAGAPEFKFTNASSAGSWVAGTWNASKTEAVILVEGPTADAQIGTVLPSQMLPLGRTTFKVRLKDTPEVEVSSAWPIDIR